MDDAAVQELHPEHDYGSGESCVMCGVGRYQVLDGFWNNSCPRRAGSYVLALATQRAEAERSTIENLLKNADRAIQSAADYRAEANARSAVLEALTEDIQKLLGGAAQ